MYNGRAVRKQLHEQWEEWRGAEQRCGAQAEDLTLAQAQNAKLAIVGRERRVARASGRLDPG